MLSINMTDVLNVLNSCRSYLIFIGVVFVLAAAVTIAVKGMQKPKRKLARSAAWLAALLAAAVTVNMICFGPMSTMIALATGSGSISEESIASATELCAEIAEEGIVLLKNENHLLPLADTENLNVFGWASTNPCYGGTGSGSLSDAYETVSLLQGLADAGFKLNEELSQFYVDYRSDRPEVGMMSQDWTLPEPAADSYSEEMINNAKEFSNTAVVVIARVGGEGADLPTDVSQVTYEDNSSEYQDFENGEHYLQLNKTERNMLEMVCSNFEKVIVVYNGANAMELGFVNEYEQIQGALWCPGTGQSGFKALGEILKGDINPSAKTTDTFVADLTATPSWNNFGSFIYDNMDEFLVATNIFGQDVEIIPSFVNYVEGIYVGYRFWETAAAEGLISYNDAVVYPFGYGLSYTEFEQKMGKITENNGVLSFDVTVTNQGNTAGKDVVEVYYNPPYTNGGIEKSAVNLAAFEKTDLIEPGASQTITISFHQEDMASYDMDHTKGYILEEGNYEISINRDSHHIIESQVYTVDETIAYNSENPRSTDKTAAANQFDHAAGDVVYLSRTDGFANYEEAAAAPASMSMPENYKETFLYTDNYNPQDYNHADDEMPATGADNGLKLEYLRGADYDDERWDTLLDEMTIDEMDNMIALGGYQTAAAASINKVQTVDCDGPASINNNFTGAASIGFPSAVLIANTWNKDIAEKFGESIGQMADEMGVSGWYAPAMNTHRSAFAGRNFEYYSEDGLLAGKIAAQAVLGAEKHGVYAYIKHFALNDQETNRDLMMCTWSNEQAIREIYLKPFEIATKEGGAKAVMAAFNYIGTEWAAASSALCQTVLRDEWGFRGFVLTDYFANTFYMNSDQAIRNGTDAMLVAYDTATNHVTDKTSATGVQAMRTAAKNILYTAVNSRAYDPENLSAGLLGWQIAAIIIDLIFAAAMAVLAVTAVRNYKKRIQDGDV